MTWEKLDLEPEPTEPVSIDLVWTEHEGKSFGAGICWVTIFGAETRATAVTDGTDRWVSTNDDALRWLQEHGLPLERAATLLASANAKDWLEEIEAHDA